MKRKLTWKHLWLDDKSGSWYSAKVPVLDWEYVIEETHGSGQWKPSVFYAVNSCEDACSLFPSDRSYKSLEAAQRACERHLENRYNKFKVWLENYEIQD